MRWVHRERTVWVGALDAAEGVAAVGEGAPEEGDDGTAEADDLHGAAVARRRRRDHLVSVQRQPHEEPQVSRLR